MRTEFFQKVWPFEGERGKKRKEKEEEKKKKEEEKKKCKQIE